MVGLRKGRERSYSRFVSGMKRNRTPAVEAALLIAHLWHG
jgi:hypothetical protein